jgi:hypothetical protein
MTQLSPRVLLLAAFVFLGACNEDPTVPPGIQPQITNNTDAFAFQITNLSNVTGTYDYTWQNTGTVARVTHSSNAGSNGTATLIVRDAVGTQVYSGALATSGQPLTSPAGVAGAWTIRLVFANYSNAQINFGVIKQ